VRKEAYLLNDFLDTFVSRQKYLAPRARRGGFVYLFNQLLKKHPKYKRPEQVPAFYI
jgi:hypothetical protein